MKKIKKIIVSVLCVVLCLSMCINASAAGLTVVDWVNKADDSNANNGKGVNYNSVMEGMCLNLANNVVYSAKINGNKNCMIIKTTLDDKGIGKKSIVMTSGGKTYVNYLGHANDMTFVNINDSKYLYVATGRGMKKVDVDYDIVKLKITGNTFERVASYKTNYKYMENGNNVSVKQGITGLAFVKKDGDDLIFLAKKGTAVYTLRISSNAGNGTVTMTDKCFLDKSAYTQYGSPQNIAYYKGKILVTYSNETSGKSNILLTYNYPCKENDENTYSNAITKAKEKLKNIKDKNKKTIKVPKIQPVKNEVIKKSDTDLYEIEAIDVGKDGNYYFALNVRIINEKNEKVDRDRIVVRK
ncbi:MAG: hypothetical protein IJF54_05320 [Clostridia bacterium]|nr:hypothetical protein [Clostridia bacterium]